MVVLALPFRITTTTSGKPTASDILETPSPTPSPTPPTSGKPTVDDEINDDEINGDGMTMNWKPKSGIKKCKSAKSSSKSSKSKSSKSKGKSGKVSGKSSKGGSWGGYYTSNALWRDTLLNESSVQQKGILWHSSNSYYDLLDDAVSVRLFNVISLVGGSVTR